MRYIACAVVLSCFISRIYANTEKVIFIAPPAISLSNDDSRRLNFGSLESIGSNSSNSLRTTLPVEFPTKASPRGVESWYILPDLNAGQRYELRVCWAAIQPAEFWLDVHTASQVLESPILLQGLTQSANRQAQIDQRHLQRFGLSQTAASVLLLQVRATADYFTTNQSLMQTPHPVSVDLILDPFLWNVFPESLVPTAGFIVILALGSWTASNYFLQVMQYPRVGKVRQD